MRERIFNWLANLVWRRPLMIFIAAIALAAVSLVYASTSLILNANTDDLISRDRPFMAQYRQFLTEFGDLEYIYVVVENPGDASRAEAVVDALTPRLRAIPGLPGVFSGIEPQEQLRIATRAMPEDELAGLSMASAAFPTLSTGDAGRVIREAAARLMQLVQTGARMPQDQRERLGAAAVFMTNSIAAAKPGSISEQEMAFLLGRDARREYFKSDSGRFYFISIMPVKDYSTLSVIEKPLEQIRAVLDQARREFPDVNIGLTGKPVLQADEMATSNADMTKAAILAFVLCAALFMVSFGGVWRPFLAIVAFGCAAAWTYGFATLTVGQLNLLSIVFMLVLVGVGLDYGVHILSRYREFRTTSDVRTSLTAAIKTAGPGNITGALTSSTVFFMALFTTFQGLRELGLIAGGGLLLCVVGMTVVLPALLVLSDRRRTGLEPPVHQNPLMNALSWLLPSRWFARPGLLLIIVLAITAALFFVPGRPRFEYNLLELQARGLESVEWERRILEDSSGESWFGAVIADDLQRVEEVIEQARQKPAIGKIQSIFDIIAPQTERRRLLREQLHAGDGPTTAPSEPAQEWTVDDLKRITGPLDLIVLGSAREAPGESRRLARISADLKSLIQEMEAGETQPEAAGAVRERIDRTIGQIAQSLRLILEGDRLDLRDALPESVRARYISPRGRFLVMLHPRENVWEYESMRQFIQQMREVDPNVTGAPIAHFESLGEMEDAFLRMAVLSVVAIALILWLDFRKIKYVLLALAPTLLGLVWTVQIMAALDISFNLANFFSVPILIGLSVDGSVHVLHRYHEGGPRRLDLGATRLAVVVTALTTIIGFGCLMIAHHRGLRSLGQVMAMGSTACLLGSIIVLPAILALLERWRPAR